MNCSEFDAEVRRLVETHSEALHETALLHAQGCPACGRLWQDYMLLEASLQAWREVRLPASLADSVIRRLHDETTVNVSNHAPAVPPDSVTGRKQWAVVVAAVACLFALVWFGLNAPSVDRDPEMARAKAQPTTPDLHPENKISSPAGPSVEVTESVVAVLDDLRSEYRQLAAATTATARDLAAVLPPPVPANWMNGVALEGPSGDTAGSNAPSGGVSEIGRSIGDQIGQAIDFLWVAVPESVPRG